MTIRDQYKCKRQALKMTQQEFAVIAGVSEGVISLFENGYTITKEYYDKIVKNVETYIRAMDRVEYLTTRILEETFMLQIEDESEHLKTLSHMMIHVSKLNMMYVD